MDDGPAEEVLEARPARIRRWQWVAIGLVLAGLGYLQFAQHRVEVVSGSGHPSTPPARVMDQLSLVVGSRCPTAVVCGVSATVSAGMAAQFHRDFPGAAVRFQASAFDAGAPRTYWQQIDATTPAGTTLVLTEQRISTAARRPRVLTVTLSPDGTTLTMTQRRGGWLVMANVFATDPRAVPAAAARRWVTGTPLPR